MFELGLLEPGDWSARWIVPVEPELAPAGRRPAMLVRGEFELPDAPVARARLYATAHGIYEAFVNGRRAGDAELTPGFTEYRDRLQVQVYDITDLLRPGRNAIGAIVSDGWFRGQVGLPRAHDQWGSELGFLAQARVEFADGSMFVAGTGAGWRSTRSQIEAADLIAGQSVDLRRRPDGWSESGFDDSGWDAVAPADHGYTNLVASPAPPVRAVQELVPVAVRQVAGGHVFDLGQNINGWVRLRDLGPAGTAITLTHGEAIDSRGDVTTNHLDVNLPFIPEPLPAGQVDRVVSAGRPGDTFEPRHTTHGFRYVRVEGHPEELGAGDLTGVAVHTDMTRTGWFRCSDDRLNGLHEAAVWSLRGNACDIPTDCPTRERAGWTGDWQIFVPTAAFLYDVAGFSTKWLRDLAAEQWSSGLVANLAPSPPSESEGGFLAALNGSAGWGDAAVIVPWEIYRAYADAPPARGAVAVDGGVVVVRGRRGRRRAASRAGSAPARAATPRALPVGLGLSLGRVARARGGSEGSGRVRSIPAGRQGRRSDRLLRVLGGADEPDRGGHRSPRRRSPVRGAGRAGTRRLAGRVHRPRWPAISPTPRPTTFARSRSSSCPAELRAAAAARLVELIRDAGTRLATGFLATPYLLPVLADAGYAEVAYELLFADAMPSWLYMIDRGATTDVGTLGRDRRRTARRSSR